MGRTPKPLKILVHPSLNGWPEVLALQEQGHEIIVGDSEVVGVLGAGGLAGFDLVVGPNCFRMLPELRGQLDLAIKGARKGKYKKEEP